jgi:hypothetical protein
MVEDWNVEEEATEKLKLYIDGEVKEEFDGEITAEDVKRVAREHELKNISVRDTLGAKLGENAFPLTQNVVISQVNKAG